MGRLEKLQRYYRHRPRRWEFKTPPALDSYVEREVARVGGVDAVGDPRYRLSWGGAALVRTSEDDPRPTLLGPATALVADGGRLDSPGFQRKPTLRTHTFKGRTRYQKCVKYRTDSGATVRVKRPDQVPADKIAEVEWEYVEYGDLHWNLEVKLTPAELVGALVYRASDPSIPARGDYICLLTLQTEDGLYLEPSAAWIDYIRLHYFEAVNGDLAKLLAEHREAEEKKTAESKRAQDERDERQFDEAVGEVLDYAERQPASARQSVPGGARLIKPGRLPPALPKVRPGDAPNQITVPSPVRIS